MVVIMSSLAALVAIVIGGRYLWKRTARLPIAAPRADSDRLQRIEEAIDTMALEIERMSEAQRFTAKLLLERGSDAAQASSAGVPEPIVNRR
jgi:hypothetical protein